jgi:hypothetical protein
MLNVYDPSQHCVVGYGGSQQGATERLNEDVILLSYSAMRACMTGSHQEWTRRAVFRQPDLRGSCRAWHPDTHFIIWVWPQVCPEFMVHLLWLAPRLLCHNS